ncbi:MAG: peptide deformylase [Spirochaetes bacterium GWB1_48_6]|nr:MAG: peptide deformylase [Spirochaetes bacterium GWB1_48_6]
MNIVKYPADILRKTTITVKDIDGALALFTQQMIEAMYRGRGIGLAAPQVDSQHSLFVVGLPDEKPLVFINPEITGTSLETNPYEEGCLSLPGLYAKVTRPTSISIQAYNEKGRPFKLEADGLLARVIQHELDHLKGVMFTDHLSDFKRERLLKEYEKARRA